MFLWVGNMSCMVFLVLAGLTLISVVSCQVSWGGAAGLRCHNLSSQIFYLVSHYPTVKPRITFMMETVF